MDDLEQVRRRFVDLWDRMSALWGIGPSSGRVDGWIPSHPVDAEAIMDGLGMSRGAVSMATRELAVWGLLLSERPPGSRRTRWRPETDLGRTIRNIVQTRKRREWDPILERLWEWIPVLRRDRSAAARTIRGRLEEIEALVGIADRMPERFLAGGAVGRFGLALLVSRALADRAGRGRRASARRRRTNDTSPSEEP